MGGFRSVRGTMDLNLRGSNGIPGSNGATVADVFAIWIVGIFPEILALCTLWWTNKKLWKITIFYGNIHYFYGHFQLLFVSSPEGMVGTSNTSVPEMTIDIIILWLVTSIRITVNLPLIRDDQNFFDQ